MAYCWILFLLVALVCAIPQDENILRKRAIIIPKVPVPKPVVIPPIDPPSIGGGGTGSRPGVVAGPDRESVPPNPNKPGVSPLGPGGVEAGSGPPVATSTKPSSTDKLREIVQNISDVVQQIVQNVGGASSTSATSPTSTASTTSYKCDANCQACKAIKLPSECTNTYNSFGNTYQCDTSCQQKCICRNSLQSSSPAAWAGAGFDANVERCLQWSGSATASFRANLTEFSGFCRKGNFSFTEVSSSGSGSSSSTSSSTGPFTGSTSTMVTSDASKLCGGNVMTILLFTVGLIFARL